MLRWIADRHRTLAAEALGHPVPTDAPVGGGSARAAPPADLGRRPDDVAGPRLGRRRRPTVGLAISLTVVLLALLVVTLVLWWFATPQLMRAAQPVGPPAC